MITVKTDRESYKDVSPTEVLLIVAKLRSSLDPSAIRARNKWQETVDLGGNRFLANCTYQRTEDLVMVTGIRRQHGRRAKVVVKHG